MVNRMNRSPKTGGHPATPTEETEYITHTIGGRKHRYGQPEPVKVTTF